jgi:hypothetical protein
MVVVVVVAAVTGATVIAAPASLASKEATGVSAKIEFGPLVIGDLAKDEVVGIGTEEVGCSPVDWHSQSRRGREDSEHGPEGGAHVAWTLT